MRTLRETVRNILLEEFACASVTNPTLQKGILELERQGMHIVSYWKPEEYDSGRANTIHLNVFNSLGDQKAYWLGEFQVTGEYCHAAFQCTNTNAQDLRGTGVGALLYDVACELVGKAGLSSDRDNVSNSAWKMWKYMWKSDAYTAVATYDWDAEQTPDDLMDDCASISWEKHDYGWGPDEHPLNKVYVKKDQTRPTIRCLELRNLIEYE